MTVSISKGVVVAMLAAGMAFTGPALTPASAYMRHGGGGHGYHGGYHGHGGYGYGYGHRRYYGGGGYYYGGPRYYGAPCVPVLGFVSGNFCNGYYY